MRKFAMLSALFIFVLTGCGKDENKTDDQSTNEATTQKANTTEESSSNESSSSDSSSSEDTTGTSSDDESNESTTADDSSNDGSTSDDSSDTNSEAKEYSTDMIDYYSEYSSDQATVDKAVNAAAELIDSESYAGRYFNVYVAENNEDFIVEIYNNKFDANADSKWLKAGNEAIVMSNAYDLSNATKVIDGQYKTKLDNQITDEKIGTYTVQNNDNGAVDACTTAVKDLTEISIGLEQMYYRVTYDEVGTVNLYLYQDPDRSWVEMYEKKLGGELKQVTQASDEALAGSANNCINGQFN